MQNCIYLADTDTARAAEGNKSEEKAINLEYLDIVWVEEHASDVQGKCVVKDVDCSCHEFNEQNNEPTDITTIIRRY